MDCTTAYLKAKERGVSFFLYYLYRALKAANEIDNFRYRILGGQVYDFDTVTASPTINRPDGTFGFAYVDYFEDEKQFYEKALEEIKNVKDWGIVVMSFDEYNSLMATNHELSSRKNEQRLDAAIDRLNAGDSFSKDLIRE